jgi:hypothetical protein
MVFAALGNLNNNLTDIIRSTENNMATLLAEKKFTNCNSSILRQQHAVDQSVFVFYQVQ